jgi:hypothetical protein
MKLTIVGSLFITDDVDDTIEAEENLPPPCTGVEPANIDLTGMEDRFRVPGGPPNLTCGCCLALFRDVDVPEMACLILARKKGDDIEGMLVHQSCIAKRITKGQYPDKEMPPMPPPDGD